MISGTDKAALVAASQNFTESGLEATARVDDRGKTIFSQEFNSLIRYEVLCGATHCIMAD